MFYAQACTCDWKAFANQWYSQAGAHALATRGCTPPVQVCIGADSIVVDHESGAKRPSNCTVQYRYVYPQNYKSRMREFAIN